ncbi:MAG: AAA family ATPase [Dehalococcoidia bacterium]|nr:AAA family ATPase [Dehalococcoidia bacterium]
MPRARGTGQPRLFQTPPAGPNERVGEPLAARMRPRTLDEFVGQGHLVGEGRVVRRAIESDRVPSMILWGPPGSGKTTLARLVAGVTSSHFDLVSAVNSGVADLRRVLADAQQRRASGERTILFIDEIHRFNKAQQDVVLPFVEDGTITLIGATTENPSFEVISPLLSRCRVYTLSALSEDQVTQIITNALADPERGLGSVSVELPEGAMQALVIAANGDARLALNALELAVAAASDDDGRMVVTKELLADALQHRALKYDRAGDAHYDTVSAFIKSLRGSDPDAALYWLARMVESGEDPLFIVRRMVILAAEDIGVADPQALVVAVACQQAVHFVGMPEGFLPMAEAAIYLATAPKSNSAYAAYGNAMRDVRETLNDPVPMHLRNAVTGLMRGMGYGQGYQYAHDHAGHFAPDQAFLPNNLVGRTYYEPSHEGHEAVIAERLARLREQRAAKAPEQDDA